MPHEPSKPQQPMQNPLKQGDGQRHSPMQGPGVGAPGANDLGGRPTETKQVPKQTK